MEQVGLSTETKSLPRVTWRTNAGTTVTNQPGLSGTEEVRRMQDFSFQIETVPGKKETTQFSVSLTGKPTFF